MRKNEPESLKADTPPVRGTWLAVILSSLPYILFALVKYGLWLSTGITQHLERFFNPLYDFSRNSPAYTWLLDRYAPDGYYLNSPIRVAYQTAQWAFGVLVVILLLVAWWRGWPRWSAVWVGFLMVVALDNLIDFYPSGVKGYLSGMAWLLMVALALFWLAWRDALRGLLAVFPIMPMMFWLFSLEGVIGNEGPYYLLIGTLMALGVGAVVRIGTVKVALAVLLPLMLAISLGVNYGTVYHSDYWTPQEQSVWRILSGSLGEILFLGIASSPLWGLSLVRAIRRRVVRA